MTTRNITFSGRFLIMEQTTPAGNKERYALCTIQSIKTRFIPAGANVGSYPYLIIARVDIIFYDGTQLSFDVQSIANQGTWVATAAGVEIAGAAIQTAQQAAVC